MTESIPSQRQVSANVFSRVAATAEAAAANNGARVNHATGFQAFFFFLFFPLERL
jgi:hypothetical protein